MVLKKKSKSFYGYKVRTQKIHMELFIEEGNFTNNCKLTIKYTFAKNKFSFPFLPLFLLIITVIMKEKVL
jgi:hypothetical protein